MEEQNQPSIRFRIVPTDRRADIRVNVHHVHGMSGPVENRADLTPFAAALARYRIEAFRNPSLALVTIDEAQFGSDGRQLFQSAWNFLQNAMCADPKVKIGKHLALVGGLSAKKSRKGSGHGEHKWIEVETTLLPERNVTFGIISRTDVPYEIRSEAQFVCLFDFLTGRCGGAELMNFLTSNAPVGPAPLDAFIFGRRSTRTTVVHRFTEGLTGHWVECTLANEPFTVPPHVEALIDRAYTVIKDNDPTVRKVPDSKMLGPRYVEVSMVDLDSGDVRVAVTLAPSSYRYYAAFAFAELLAEYDKEFEPLFEFTRATPIPSQPGPATCSIGVRVLLECSDRRFIVSHRSSQVKLNPDVWSVSANEGVRTSLLEKGLSCSDVLFAAARRAALSELRVQPAECQDPILLSMYRNEFNQWGAGFYVRTDLASSDVIRRQPAAIHGFEHKTISTIPVNIDDCGRAMRELGVRWYGGALETICTALAWRETGGAQFTSATEVAAALSRGAGDGIVPIDEPNPVLIPKRP